ncbi:hypothetical protein ACLB2K_015335 [Fragaria x ananassa]
MTIWKTICNLVHPRTPAMLSIVSGFVRKIICNFLGVLVHLRRGKKDTTVKISGRTELVKLCDPPTTETVEILIEPNNNDAESQTGCKIEEPNASKYTYCDICKNRDHDLEMCPDRFGKVITVCSVCGHLPCKNEADDHKEHHYVCLLYCHLCDEIGDHLTELCPDMESDLGDEDWDSNTDDDNWDNQGDLPENTQTAAAAA